MNEYTKVPPEYLYKCPKCNMPFYSRMRRGWFVKSFFPNRPIRRFFCGNCKKAYYVRVDVSLFEH